MSIMDSETDRDVKKKIGYFKRNFDLLRCCNNERFLGVRMGDQVQRAVQIRQ